MDQFMTTAQKDALCDSLELLERIRTRFSDVEISRCPELRIWLQKVNAVRKEGEALEEEYFRQR